MSAPKLKVTEQRKPTVEEMLKRVRKLHADGRFLAIIIATLDDGGEVENFVFNSDDCSRIQLMGLAADLQQRVVSQKI